MTLKEYRDLFAKDENGCFTNLIIPADDEYGELNLIGKPPLEFTVDEVIRMKKYASDMFETVTDVPRRDD